MSTSKIMIGTVGKIRVGDESGCWLRVDDDSENTGGFLVHVSPNPEFTGGSGDDWVESLDDLVAYFKECRWEVDWLDNS